MHLMNEVSWLFVYTPLPWLAAMYVAAYRHDLARIARPLRDHASLNDWWSVCGHLGLVSADARRPSRRVPEVRLLLALVSSAVVSLLWLAPVPLAWYYLVAMQAASALPLFLLMVYRVGPLPFKPYRDVLPYPRLGSRVRHLQQRRRPIKVLTRISLMHWLKRRQRA